MQADEPAAGSFIPAAMSSSGMLDVLVASSAVGLRLRLDRGEQRALGVEILEDRLDDDVGAGDAVARDIGDQAVGARRARGAGPSAAPSNSFGCAGHRRRDPLRVLVLQRDGQSAQRAPRRDVAAHRAGTDDVHVRGLEIAVLAERLQALLQAEHADQVGGGRRLRAAPESTPGRTRAPQARRRRTSPTAREWRTARDNARAARALRRLPRLRRDERPHQRIQRQRQRERQRRAARASPPARRARRSP